MNSVEEQLYAQAAQEVAARQVAKGVMAKAFVDANGDEKKAVVLYIKMRVEQLKSELAEEIQRRNTEAERQRQEELLQKFRQFEKQEDVESLSVLDTEEQGQYAILRSAYSNRVIKSRYESASQFRRRIAWFWKKYQRECDSSPSH